MLIEKLSEETRLIQLAEEAAELAQAALKIIRVRHGETPVTEEQARKNLLEEIADVLVCIDVLTSSADRVKIRSIKQRKKARWEKRIND